MQRKVVSVMVLAGLVVLIAGCGKKASETATEKAMESAMKAQGQDANVNVDSNTVQISTKEGAMSFGEGTKLPDNWPDDVPVYKGLKLVSSVASGDGFSIQGTTPDAQDKVAAYYKEQAEKGGWTEDTTMTQAQMVMLSYTKENRGLNVMISGEDSETSVSINVSNE